MCKAKWWLFTILLIIFLLTGWVAQVQSQEKYPTRAIDLIVPFAPGASTDLVARIAADYLNKIWKVPVNVINKPGGNTVPACLEVYSAKPDGYTLLVDNNPSSSMTPIVVKKLPYKIMDRAFIAIISEVPMVPIVHSGSPFKSLKDLEIEAKKDPENFTWTSLGGVGGQDSVIRQFLKAIGVDVKKTKPVIAKGGAESVALTAGGHVKMGSSSISSAIPAIKGGMVRTLAMAAKERWPDLPDIPTAGEVGYSSVDVVNWLGLSGPPKLPSNVVDALDKAQQEFVKDPEIVQKLRNMGTIPIYRDAKATIEHVMKKMDEVEKLWGLK